MPRCNFIIPMVDYHTIKYKELMAGLHPQQESLCFAYVVKVVLHLWCKGCASPMV